MSLPWSLTTLPSFDSSSSSSSQGRTVSITLCTGRRAGADKPKTVSSASVPITGSVEHQRLSSTNTTGDGITGANLAPLSSGVRAAFLTMLPKVEAGLRAAAAEQATTALQTRSNAAKQLLTKSLPLNLIPVKDERSQMEREQGDSAACACLTDSESTQQSDAAPSQVRWVWHDVDAGELFVHSLDAASVELIH